MSESDRRFDVVVVLVDLAGGGTQRVVRRLVDTWAARGRRVLLVTSPVDDGRWDDLAEGIVHLTLAGSIPTDSMVRARRVVGQALGVLRMAGQLRRYVRRSAAPVVASFLTGTNLLTLVACLGLGRRLVACERNDTTRQRFSWPVRVARRLLYKTADVVTANSQVGVEGVAGYVSPAKLALIPNDVVVPADPADPASCRTVLTVGRLAEHKEHLLLVEAFRRLVDDSRAEGWRLRFVGEGPMRETLERASSHLRAAGHVELTGHLDDVEPAYRDAGIFVLPSRYEGAPNALLEAMAYGLPCVVSDSLPGALEHVEHGVTGLVFSAGDAGDLAARIGQLVDDAHLRVAIGSRARQAMEALDSESILELWEQTLWS